MILKSKWKPTLRLTSWQYSKKPTNREDIQNIGPCNGLVWDYCNQKSHLALQLNKGLSSCSFSLKCNSEKRDKLSSSVVIIIILLSNNTGVITSSNIVPSVLSVENYKE